jgi:hypothetical protein
MLKYPSSAVEQTRESIYSSKNPLETILLLTCLVKNGMREDKKNTLISEYVSQSSLTEDEIVNIYQMLGVETIHGLRKSRDQERLGVEPSGQYRHEEYLIGKALETIFDIRLYRSSTPMYDFVFKTENWELVGPVAPFYFDSDSFLCSLNYHLDNKKGMDTLIVCTATLPQEDQEEIVKLIEEDGRCSNIDVLFLDNDFLSSESACNFRFQF